MKPLLTDLRRATRRLRKAPAFALAVVATLALGIGATAAVFTLVRSVLLRPLPFPDSDRIVAVGHTAPGFGIEKGGLSEGIFLHYREHNRVFEEMGVYMENVVSVTDADDDPERVHVALVTPGVFPVLGATPFLGRIFTPADADPDAASVVVIGHELWTRRYGADPGIVGRTIELNRAPREVIGVLPPGFSFPDPETQVWYSMPVEAVGGAVRELHLSGVGRLRPGVSPEEGAADLRRLTASLPEAYGDVTPDELRTGAVAPVVRPLRDEVVGEVRRPLVILLCTAVFVLLIACANVTNLFLVRAERQRQEVTVERALGASGGDLARRFLSESFVLAGIGGVLGLVVAYLGVRSRFGFEPGQIPRLHEVGFDAAVVGATLGLTVGVATVLGLMSLLRVARSDIPSVLKGGLGRATPSRQWQSAQRLLVALQIGLALTLLIGSAVMVQSLWRLKQVDMGFDPERVLALELAFPVRQYPSYHDAARGYHQVLEQLRTLPGVIAAEAVSTLPLAQVPTSFMEPVSADPGGALAGEVPPMAAFNLATPGYFEAMRMPLVRGRVFQPGDLANAERPVVVSEALARTLFRGADPVGRRVRLPGRPADPAYTVVGVVRSTPGERIADGPASVLYFPVLADGGEGEPQYPLVPRDLTLVVRTGLPPASTVAAARRVVRDVDPKLPIGRVRTLEDVVDDSTAHTRFTAVLLLAAAGAALFLGVIGIYGIIAYTVSQRTPEFGVRLALGASPREVSRMVLLQGALLALAGIGVGVAAAFGLMRFLGSLVYEVSPSDPVVFAAMSALLFAVAVAASFFPAHRAGRVDPIRALKAE